MMKRPADRNRRWHVALCEKAPDDASPRSGALGCDAAVGDNRWAAERALHAIRQASRSQGQKVPSGSYWCRICRTWHLTCKSKSRVPTWLRRTRK